MVIFHSCVSLTEGNSQDYGTQFLTHANLPCLGRLVTKLTFKVIPTVHSHNHAHGYIWYVHICMQMYTYKIIYICIHMHILGIMFDYMYNYDAITFMNIKHVCKCPAGAVSQVRHR